MRWDLGDFQTLSKRVAEVLDTLGSIRRELDRIFGETPRDGAEDPFALLTRIDSGRIPALRIDCGTEDFLLERNRAFHRHLESPMIPQEYQGVSRRTRLGLLGPARARGHCVSLTELAVEAGGTLDRLA